MRSGIDVDQAQRTLGTRDRPVEPQVASTHHELAVEAGAAAPFVTRRDTAARAREPEASGPRFGDHSSQTRAQRTLRELDMVNLLEA